MPACPSGASIWTSGSRPCKGVVKLQHSSTRLERLLLLLLYTCKFATDMNHNVNTPDLEMVLGDP